MSDTQEKKQYEGVGFVFDIDGTICPIKKKEEHYEDLVPYKEIVEKIMEYREKGIQKEALSNKRSPTRHNAFYFQINRNFSFFHIP